MTLTQLEIEKIAEEMRNRHYIKFLGYWPPTPFKDLVGDRRLKWLDQVKVAIELLTPHIKQ